jgi:hypothetical protein
MSRRTTNSREVCQRTWPIPRLEPGGVRQKAHLAFNAAEWRQFRGCVDAEIMGAVKNSEHQILLQVRSWCCDMLLLSALILLLLTQAISSLQNSVRF